MSQDKTLPGATIRFATAGSTGYHTNHFGVGQMSICLQRPGAKYPWLDLGNINFSDPTPDQFAAAEKAKAEQPYTKEGSYFADIHRHVSKRQAEYINYLICDMLEEVLKGEIPADDEIYEIMRDKREANYPVNREKREQEKKYQLTAEQNVVLGKLREEAYKKNIVFSIEFENNGCGGRIRFTKPGANMSFVFIDSSGFFDAVKKSIYQLEQLPTIRWNIESRDTSQSASKPPFPPNRIESENHNKFTK